MTSKKASGKTAPPVDPDDIVVEEFSPTPADALRKQRCENCVSWRSPQMNSPYGTCHRGPGPQSATVALPPQVFDPNSNATMPIPVTYSGWPQTLPNDFCTTGWSNSGTIH
jgi:hypothetical protein